MSTPNIRLGLNNYSWDKTKEGNRIPFNQLLRIIAQRDSLLIIHPKQKKQ